MQNWVINILTTGDKILIAVLLILNLLALVFTVRGNAANALENYAVIQINGEVIEKIQYSKNSELIAYSFKFGDEIGEIEIKDGRVRMKAMDKSICPEGICSDTGWIEGSYESIVCLPNKIIVTLEKVEESTLDVISR